MQHLHVFLGEPNFGPINNSNHHYGEKKLVLSCPRVSLMCDWVTEGQRQTFAP